MPDAVIAASIEPRSTFAVRIRARLSEGLIHPGPQMKSAAAKEINRRRHQEHLFVFAVDLPTGLNGDSGEIDPEDCVIADFTITIGFAKHPEAPATCFERFFRCSAPVRNW